MNATKFGTKIKFHLISFGLYHAVEIDHTILLLVFVAKKVLPLLVISLTVHTRSAVAIMIPTFVEKNDTS